MSKEFVDELPLDGEVIINWVRSEPEYATYRGYLAGNTRRCAVHVAGAPKGHNIWVDRQLLSVPLVENKS